MSAKPAHSMIVYSIGKVMNMRRFKTGDRVRVWHGAGIDSGKTGVIVNYLLSKTAGWYPSICAPKWVAIQDDKTGEVFSMAKCYLQHI